MGGGARSVFLLSCEGARKWSILLLLVPSSSILGLQLEVFDAACLWHSMNHMKLSRDVPMVNGTTVARQSAEIVTRRRGRSSCGSCASECVFWSGCTVQGWLHQILRSTSRTSYAMKIGQVDKLAYLRSVDSFGA